jgi:hypothetical protein
MNLSSLQTSASGITKSLATAALALAATAPLMTAQAVVVYTPLSTVVPASASAGGASVNVTFASESFNLAAASNDGKGNGGLRFSSLPADFRIANFTTFTPEQDFANAAASGSTIGSAIAFSSLPQVRIGYSLGSGGTGYFGFQFTPVVGGPVDYGWASFSYTAAGNVTLTGYAYENTGLPITVGFIPAVPEPSMPLLMAAGLGVMGLVYRRRGNRSAV